MPLRADGSPLLGVQVSWLADRRPRRPSRGSVTSVAFVGRRLPAHSCATAPVSHRIPLVPCSNLSRLDELRRTLSDASGWSAW